MKKTNWIIDIIKAGKEADVAKIEMQGFIITYKGSEPDQGQAWPQYKDEIQTKESSLIQTDSISKELSELQKELNKELLMVADPVGYEKALLSGEIVNE